MSADIHAERLLILDYGSQYTQLIARRIRALGVYCEVLPGQVEEVLIRQKAPKAIILSGGPQSVIDEDSLRVPSVVFELGCPVLGICYGMQAMMQALGGEVSSGGKAEYGPAKVNVLDNRALFSTVESEESGMDVWMSHGDYVSLLPAGFHATASTEGTPYAAVANLERQFFGLQFHPEVTHTPQGDKLLSYFLQDVCGFSGTWTLSNIIEDQIERLRSDIGDDDVLLALSGGVDSSVVAALLNRAIGKQLHCLFVDTGLSRLNEPEQVKELFVDHFGMDLIIVDAKDDFFDALAGVDDPEKKRKIIGHLFIEIFERESVKLSNKVSWLAQGTIYPDVIESAAVGSGHAEVIKSHHNVGGLPDDMNLKLVEPIRELFKDEVRKIGLELGLPQSLIGRHPFPGPGLGVRCLGALDREQVAILQRADHLFLEILHKHGWYDQVSQAFAVFLPVKAVGVKGDARAYGYVIALRAVVTIDFMTAEWAQLPADLLQDAAHRITSEINEVTRVVYDITSKPPGTIEWE
jgi:GMP synthase (glutamine-hydrolysing)